MLLFYLLQDPGFFRFSVVRYHKSTFTREETMTSRTGNIRIDEERYMSIVRGKLRQDLRKYLNSGGIIFHTGEIDRVSVTIDEIEIPSWRFGFPELLIGHGKGKPGDDLGPVPPDDGDGDEKGEGGEGHGERHIVVDLTPDEFADYLEETLNLPRIQPKGDRTVVEQREKYNTVAHQGPHSMLDRRRTLIEALKHSIASGHFDPAKGKTEIIVDGSDQRFQSYSLVQEPKNNAVIFFMRDVSGSMGPRERRIVSFLCNLCSFWLSRNYDRLEEVFVIHDDQAEEVDKSRFFGEDWGGGTKCSTALAKASEIIDDKFPPSLWNIYVVYLSDGFNWGDDNDEFLELLGTKLLPVVNQFNYGQIHMGGRDWFEIAPEHATKSFSAPGTLGEKIEETFGNMENLALAEIDTESFESATEAIKTFFQAGN